MMRRNLTTAILSLVLTIAASALAPPSMANRFSFKANDDNVMHDDALPNALDGPAAVATSKMLAHNSPAHSAMLDMKIGLVSTSGADPGAIGESPQISDHVRSMFFKRGSTSNYDSMITNTILTRAAGFNDPGGSEVLRLMYSERAVLKLPIHLDPAGTIADKRRARNWL